VEQFPKRFVSNEGWSMQSLADPGGEVNRAMPSFLLYAVTNMATFLFETAREHDKNIKN